MPSTGAHPHDLRTLPFVSAKLRAGTQGIRGRVFDIRSGRFRAWDEAVDRWRLIEETS